MKIVPKWAIAGHRCQPEAAKSTSRRSHHHARAGQGRAVCCTEEAGRVPSQKQLRRSASSLLAAGPESETVKPMRNAQPSALRRERMAMLVLCVGPGWKYCRTRPRSPPRLVALPMYAISDAPSRQIACLPSKITYTPIADGRLASTVGSVSEVNAIHEPTPRVCMEAESIARTSARYRCSKSTGAVTSCTRKYFASAGYFRATASYIAYATLR